MKTIATLLCALVLNTFPASANPQDIYEHYVTGSEVPLENSDDILINTYSRTEQQSCQAPGYCYGTGYNVMTQKVEYFYGYQSSCPGKEERTVTIKTYRRKDKSTYDDVSYGYWSSCRT